MKTIHKQLIEVKGEQLITIPKDGKILSIQNQQSINMLCVWYTVDSVLTSNNWYVDKKIYIYGTGETVKEFKGKYFTTVQMANGNLIWHIFIGE